VGGWDRGGVTNYSVVSVTFVGVGVGMEFPVGLKRLIQSWASNRNMRMIKLCIHLEENEIKPEYYVCFGFYFFSFF
jgi:hypothetical protein